MTRDSLRVSGFCGGSKRFYNFIMVTTFKKLMLSFGLYTRLTTPTRKLFVALDKLILSVVENAEVGVDGFEK